MARHGEVRYGRRCILHFLLYMEGIMHHHTESPDSTRRHSWERLYHALDTLQIGGKTLAVYLGFAWRDPEPSGAGSIQWYHRWIDSGDLQIKQRILEYNEDDCLAMRILADKIRGMKLT